MSEVRAFRLYYKISRVRICFLQSRSYPAFENVVLLLTPLALGSRNRLRKPLRNNRASGHSRLCLNCSLRIRQASQVISKDSPEGVIVFLSNLEAPEYRMWWEKTAVPQGLLRQSFQMQFPFCLEPGDHPE